MCDRLETVDFKFANSNFNYPDHKSLSNVPLGAFGLFFKDASGTLVATGAILVRIV